MIRPPFPCLHVINRDAGLEPVFRDPDDARAFLLRLGELTPRFGVEVHAYCVMGSHYHALLRGPESRLGEAIRHLEGARFRERHRALPVTAERQRLEVTRYIHLNPVAAGLVRRPEDWPWSSYRGYLNPPEGPRWLVTRFVLAPLGSIGAHAKYRVFVEAAI
ncbi:MAG TPA: hypothetical protein VF139_08575 [Candidatus Polarisedimenticolaceae bacterium]